MNDMSTLRSIREEIRLNNTPDAFTSYFNSVRQWLNGQLTLEEFDEIAQRLISVNLHTQFLVELIKIFDPKQTNFQKQTPQATSNVVFISTKPEWSNFHTRTVSGWLPDASMIRAWAFLIAMSYDLEDVEPNIPLIIHNHVRTVIGNILESVLKMSRSSISTDTGFTHSYGVQKINLNSLDAASPSTISQVVRCIVPSKEKLNAEDVLDCFDLESTYKISGGLIPHMTLKSRFLKRLENIAQSSVDSMQSLVPSSGFKRPKNKEDFHIFSEEQSSQ